MGKGAAIVASGSCRLSSISRFLLLAGFTVTGGQAALAQESAPSCAPAIARVVALQGDVDVQRAGTGTWLGVKRLDTSICAGDRLRTAPLSRAALFVQPETLVRVDQNTTIALQQTTDEILIEFHTDEVAQTAQDAQSCGAGYFITRFPRKFKVTTAHLNAAVEGTEFMVVSSCEATELTVLEGQVLSQVAATRDARSLSAGQKLVTGSGTAPIFSTVIKPADAVQWVLHYPPLSDASPDSGVQSAEQAEALLRLGRVDEALEQIDAVLAAGTRDATALALRSIIQITKNDKTAAMATATAATVADSRNYRAWLALSYAQQAVFELEPALASARQAGDIKPESSLVNARIAELLMSLGRAREAEAAARGAVDSNPAESRAHSVLGFVHLAQTKIDEARAAFEVAIDRDSFASLPRLGLGLALIREGRLTRGREELEIAVALDPSNSLVRSYAGKAYYEENSRERDELAAAQFELAKELDTRDPTPWFYQAILKDSENRPVDSLRELQTSIEKNSNRAVYRSRLLLEDDAAARAASVAAVYDNLGFEKLAIVESTKALAENAGNSSAHRQLASAYASIPRHDIARVSEALQAQIRQPVSLSSVGPLLTTDNLVINKDTGPARPGANEFNALFNRNDMRIQFDGIVGGLDTYGDQFVVSLLENSFSYTLSQLRYETDGFVENDASEKDIYQLFVHGQISPNTSIQLDAKRSDVSVGQTFAPFDEFAIPTTILERSDTLRTSGQRLLDSGESWIWSAVVEDRQREVRSFPDGGLFTNSDASPYAIEVQYLGQYGEVQLMAGAGIVEENEHFRVEQAEARNESANAYAYAQWKPTERTLSFQFGLAAERFRTRTTSAFTTDVDALDRSQLSPKFGLVWSPRSGTTVRAAALSAVHRPFIRSQTIEPTQVAGFNQFFSGFERFYGDFIGTISDRVGVALDQAFSSTVFGGVELASRRLEVPSFVLDRDFIWREKTAHVYFYKTYSSTAGEGSFGGWQASISAELEYEEIDRPQILTGAEGIMDLESRRAPFGIRLFNGRGTTLRLATTYVEQDGIFSIDEFQPVVEREDEAWITDFSLEQRLPRRKGVITLGVRNVFDESIDLLEIDPVNPRVATKQFVFARFSLAF